MKLFASVMFVLSAVLVVSSCTSGKKSLREHKGSYLESVKLNFEAGEEALKKNEYEKAITYFQFVRSKYPFSKYAALSDLKIADAKFIQKKWLDAASAYEIFIRLHPRHEKVAFASFRVGASYFHAVPSDFFLLPPSASRDQSFTKEALASIERFVLQFPDSENLLEAQNMRLKLFSSLAQHNIHIADYYQRRGQHEAAVSRYLEVQSLYPETSESAKSLYLAAIILERDLKELERTTEVLMILVDQKQESEYFEKAKERLSKILNAERTTKP